MFKKTMIPGILGMLLIILALLCGPTETQRWLFFLGALGMTLMALLERHKLFIGLQIVIISGTLTAFLPTGDLVKGFIPAFVSLPILYLLYTKGILDTWGRGLGALALITLGIGYAAQHSLIYFLGGLLVSLFSLLEFYSGFKPALIWLSLNLIFTTLAGITILF